MLSILKKTHHHQPIFITTAIVWGQVKQSHMTGPCQMFGQGAQLGLRTSVSLTERCPMDHGCITCQRKKKGVPIANWPTESSHLLLILTMAQYVLAQS